MFMFISDALRRFRRDERGNIFILFGASAIPLLLIMGGAVDITRYARYKTELTNAVDAAALAVARQHPDYTAADATTFVNNYIAAFNIPDSAFSVNNVTATTVTNGFHVVVQASMKTTFLPLGSFVKSGTGISSMPLSIVSEVVNSSGQVELALVLDNTGSMNCGATVSSSCSNDWSTPASTSRIVGLKTAANSLINILMAQETNDYVKIGIVPFEGAVNTGYNQTNVPAWIDWNDAGTAKWDGANFSKRDTGTGASCASGTNCKPVGHKWLFTKLNAKNSNVKWEGCVEMRAEPYDITDATPTTATPDTLYVPFFWPDEPDSNNDNGDSYQNDYLNDKGTFTTSGHQDPAGAQKSFNKYFPSSSTANITFQSGAPDTAFPFENGPNYGCPRPIVPLTNTKSTVTTAISNLVAYPAMGTFIPTGLVWGWHVLSPTEPFTQGIAPSDPNYDKTVKAIVLMTDGDNSITATSNHNKSIFNAYNYTATTDSSGNPRLGSTNASTAESNMNTKTATLCANIKAANIRIYTITFGTLSSTSQTLMTNCASVVDGETQYYNAPDNATMNAIFTKIGHDLADIHLSM